MARIDSFLRLVVDQRASDLHFHAGSVPLIRHDGDLVPLPFRVLGEDEARRFLHEILTPDQRQALEAEGEVDFAYDLPEVGRFRANVLNQSRGLGAVFRVIPRRIPDMAELRLPLSIRKLLPMQNGLVLMTGPTGAGKSTTLAACIAEINATSARHVITVEDPIEFVHEPSKCVITQRQVGKHVDSFASALRSALRESPDVLVVGEMRDLATVSLALQAAETGVLVFGTLHTNSAAKAIDRLVDVFPEEQHEQVRGLVSVLLKGVVAQTLCKRLSGEGRVAAFEVLLHNYAIANMIRENKVHQIDAYLQSSESTASGMLGLDQCLLAYVRERLIDVEEAVRHSNYPDNVRTAATEIALNV
jgi:twitching motility protein PilT